VNLRASANNLLLDLAVRCSARVAVTAVNISNKDCTSLISSLILLPNVALCLLLQTTTIIKYKSKFVDHKIGMLLYEKIFQ